MCWLPRKTEGGVRSQIHRGVYGRIRFRLIKLVNKGHIQIQGVLRYLRISQFIQFPIMDRKEYYIQERGRFYSMGDTSLAIVVINADNFTYLCFQRKLLSVDARCYQFPAIFVRRALES